MNPNDAIQMAAKLANQGRLAEADKVCRDIIAANDKYHPAYHLLGQLAFQAGRADIAAQMLQKAVMLDANRASYHRDLAEAALHDGKANDVINIINRALSLDGNDPKSHFIAGLAMMTLGHSAQAISALKTTIKLAPDFGAAYNNLGSLLEGAGKTAEAEQNYQKAVELDKGNAQAQTNLASILIARGDTERAQEHLSAAIEARPDYIEAHHNLSALKSYEKGDPHIKILEQLAEGPAKLSPENQIRLKFILGKVYADIGDYDKAFEHYRTGNEQKRASIDYNEDEETAVFENIKTTFAKNYFNGIKKSKGETPTPIFIVGMPRSGSTLIEQILSGHSDVHAAGELPVLSDIIKSKIKNFPNDMGELSDDDYKQIGEEYLKSVRAINPDATHIVDKMPANYRFAGLIAKILPTARIINTRRNPLDCCLSNYTHMFLHTVQFAYDLGELGRCHNRYQHLMNHWHNVLPKGILIDVSYEDVVSDLEGEARKLIDFVGLDWQEECLAFDKQTGPVNTASAAQVRKPIYKSSIEKWCLYEKHLGPLIEVLKD